MATAGAHVIDLSDGTAHVIDQPDPVYSLGGGQNAGLGGKGGGSKDFAQGSVPNAADLEQVVQRAQKSLSSK